MRKVVITGIGAVTPLGNDINSTWDNIISQRSGISLITRFDAAALKSRIAGELKDFVPGNYMPAKDILRLDPFVQYAAAAALMACENAGLSVGANGRSPMPGSAAVIIGSSRGGITSMEKALENYLLKGKPFSAYLMSASTINMAAAYISMNSGIKGPSLGISTACASGTNAIGEAFRMIQHGDIDIALAGGAEAPVCRLSVGGYGASGALSIRNTGPDKASRPFDRDRDGFVVAEGACVLVLEALDHAIKRDAVIYAELAGYVTTSDAFHQTKPESGGEADAMTKALKDADVRFEEVDYINAHATSTLLGDTAEARAIRQVFGDRSADIHISCCKSMLGHMLGAAGALEAAITALSIQRGIITPTINLENQDPSFGLNIATSVISEDINIAISNSFGFGGVNAVLVLRKFNQK
ncbi:MAG: beta-ketoacyl-ACP synthase II [Nitrospiraceae bacterium]|nr:MAG: beta-ketoacyl-ACP synthase II [Nitrospiraceae bacterium]